MPSCAESQTRNHSVLRRLCSFVAPCSHWPFLHILSACHLPHTRTIHFPTRERTERRKKEKLWNKGGKHMQRQRHPMSCPHIILLVSGKWRKRNATPQIMEQIIRRSDDGDASMKNVWVWLCLVRSSNRRTKKKQRPCAHRHRHRTHNKLIRENHILFRCRIFAKRERERERETYFSVGWIAFGSDSLCGRTRPQHPSYFRCREITRKMCVCVSVVASRRRANIISLDAVKRTAHTSVTSLQINR